MNTATLSLQLLQDNQAALETLRGKFAGIASDVTLSNRDWRELMESGALASLSISRYRGHKQLTAADLGLDSEEFKQVESILSLGHRLLLPKDVLGAFNSLETRARQVLRQYTLKVPTGYFLPASAYDACAAAMADHKAKFSALVDELLYSLPNHRYTIADQYLTLGDQVARRLYMADLLSYGAKLEFPYEFQTRCMSLFPLESELRDAFRFDLRLSFVPAPYQAAQGELPSYANASAELLSLRRAVLAEQVKIQTEEVSGFISAIQSEVYTLLNESLTNVLDGIKDKGFLQSRSTVQLKNLVERLGQLNFWQDAKIDLIKQEITAILDRPAAKREITLDTGILETMRQEVALSLLQIGQAERGDLNLSQAAPIKIALPEQRLEAPIKLAPPISPTLMPTSNLSTNRTSKRLF